MSVEDALPGSPVRLFLSERGRFEGLDPAPFLLYGKDAPALAELFARYSTLNALSIEGLANLAGLLRHLPRAVGLLATSREGRAGEAGEALAIFRGAQPRRSALLYGAWDPNVARAAARALEYGAHGLVPPRIELGELFDQAIGCIRAAASGEPPPATVEEHVASLRARAPRSPFWRLQGRAASENY